MSSEKGEVELDRELSKTASVPAVLESQAPERRAQWTTTRVELWAFYVYYIVSIIPEFILDFCVLIRRAQGNNGLSGFNFGPSQFQNLLYLAGYDPSQAPYTAPCGSGTDCVLPFMGRVRDSKFSDAPTAPHSLTPHASPQSTPSSCSRTA